MPAICAVARERGISTLLDNTWATPLLFPAIAAGVDITILAATKYVGGHADVMIGAASATGEHFDRTPEDRAGTSATPSRPTMPGSARAGLRTLAVRLKQHEATALKIAHWLKERPEVGQVLHPGPARLPRARDLEARFQGLVRPVLVRAARARRRRPRRLRRQPRAVRHRLQLGRLRKPGASRSILSARRRNRRAKSLVRLHIGLEDPDDLIEDLAAALAKL